MPFDDMRQQLELKLRGELLRDWCRQLAVSDNSVEFDDGWCSGQHAIRFSTSTIDALVGEWRGAGDCWGLGRLAFYQIENSEAHVRLALVLSRNGMPADLTKRLRQLMADYDSSLGDGGARCTLQSWSIAEGSANGNDAVEALNAVWLESVVPFERDLASRMLDADGGPSREKEGAGARTLPAALDDEPLIEGAELAVVSDRFERNKKARALCIAAHGAVCAVCGFDFGRVYGSELAGIIDVHHKVPLSEIREGHVVDPVDDLVPLCPNCHRAIHSKPGGGVYTVAELETLLRCDTE